MPFSIRPHRRLPVCCPATYHTGLRESVGSLLDFAPLHDKNKIYLTLDRRTTSEPLISNSPQAASALLFREEIQPPPLAFPIGHHL